MTEVLTACDIEFLQNLFLEIYDEHRSCLTAEQEHDILYAVGLLEHRYEQIRKGHHF